jgi:hypothetical protein
MHATTVFGHIPHRLALAGGWIDQPFVSRLNPRPPGSMVVVSLDPHQWFMERSGIASGTRKVAMDLWSSGIPNLPPASLVRELYRAENAGKAEPSGSQDMIGLLYPGVSRLDYDFECDGGVFPAHIESNRDPVVLRWLQQSLHLVPINQRPEGYNPLGVKNLDPAGIAQLGESGKLCFTAIVRRDLAALGAAMNLCMRCWKTLLPATVSHPTIAIDLKAILAHFQALYPGAMYSGCGGGYLIVASDEPVRGALQVKVRE